MSKQRWNCNCRYAAHFNRENERGATTTCRKSFVKCVSFGTVILKGESVENKSPQQSWPIFTLECFQRQQSLFSYAINCLNRLPVEFLMCYKFHVCFPRVDGAQAYCVRPCPVISAGLGRTSTQENPPVLSSLQLTGLLCTNLSFISFLPQWNLPLHLHGTSMAFCNVRFLCVRLSYSRGRCETWRGSLSNERRCQTDYPAAHGRVGQN